MQVGLVGAPNSGKSTFMKACTLADVEIQNYPFTTIEANRGVGYVTTDCACQDMDVTCDPNSKCVDGKRFVPVKMLDVAGLVPDAHEGRGLGNQFLDDLREADVLIHVLDISGQTDAEGEPTDGYDPYQNVEFLERELEFWFEKIFEREWDRLSSEVKMEGREFEDLLLSRFSGLKIEREDIRNVLNKRGLDPKDPGDWEKSDIQDFTSALREQTKPMILAANKIDKEGSDDNYRQLKEKTSRDVVPCCAEAELALREASKNGIVDYLPGSDSFEITDEEGISEEQRKALDFVERILESYGSTGVQKCMNKAVLDLLDMMVVYPVEDKNKLTDSKGNVLPDAVLLERGSTAEDLAYEIHSDIGEEFIGAIDCKTDRKIGADHELEHGDIIKILN
ncbi:MAG: redox-regulated ATPase YchF [Candidatus Aenigmatarchaeota archaeon]